MYLTRTISAGTVANKMTIAFDIGKKIITYYSEIPEGRNGVSSQEIAMIRGDLANTTSGITTELKRLESVAAQHGYTGLHVVCEPDWMLF
jgi:hypothetical protein